MDKIYIGIFLPSSRLDYDIKINEKIQKRP